MTTYSNRPKKLSLVVDNEVPHMLEITVDDDEMNSSCWRHHPKGRAYPSNCWECRAEAIEEANDDESNDD